jgi:lysyl-tRNA synthetase class 2
VSIKVGGSPDLKASDWQPVMVAEALAARSRLLAQIRGFFAERSVLEVETPLLCAGTITDPNIDPMALDGRWLQTSPEYAMKRLLAAGSGPIYQVCKAFREGESGPQHNPEFSLLEWYRPGFTLGQLMKEVAELVGQVLSSKSAQSFSYRELFQHFLQIDPFTIETNELAAFAKQRIDVNFAQGNHDLWLNLLLSHLIQPQLVGLGMVFVHDFPPSQAALARLRPGGEQLVAERFELYSDGIELANGYRELTDPAEQLQRFERDNQLLRLAGKPARPVDFRLLQALQAGLPDCSGVALGIDRLLMNQMGASDLAEVISFAWQRA